MQPVISHSRVHLPSGLWTPKLSGDFEEGDPLSTRFSVSGHVDIKELGGHLRLFMTNVVVKQRKILLSDKEKQKIAKQYRDAKRKIRLEELKAEYEKDDTKDVEDAEEDVDAEFNYTIDEEDDEETKADKLKRKAAEDEAINSIIKEREDQVLPVPKLSVYLMKRKPKLKMSGAHNVGTRIHLTSQEQGLFGRSGSTGDFECSLKDVPDVLTYMGIAVLKLPNDDPKSEDSVVYGIVKLTSSRGSKHKSTHAMHLSEVHDAVQKLLTAQENPNSHHANRINNSIRSSSYYTDIATKSWLAFQIGMDDKIDFDLFLNMLQFNAIFLITMQARRYFDTVDFEKNNSISILEFENFLMLYDVLGAAGPDLLVLDTYDTLKCRPMKESAEFGGMNEGLDYTAFQECCQMLGVRDVEDEDFLKAFLEAAKANIRNLDKVYLTHAQFKKAWLRVANLEHELVIKRKLKFDGGLMTQARNRDRLYRIVTDQEEAYLSNLSKVLEMVEKVKRTRRQKKDDSKREKAAKQEALMHQAEKFIAIRSQEKRLQSKNEQEEKEKKRFEMKALRQKLLERQNEAAAAKRAEIMGQALEAEKLRADEIKARGLDRLDISVRNHRSVPPEIYQSEEAQARLSYLLSLDMSKNILENLPEKNFMVWMYELRRLKLSQNRLKRIPEDEFGKLVALEIFEIESNRLESLPDTLSNLTQLQRLDVSNNQLTRFPESLGYLYQLKFLKANSNHFEFLPNSVSGLAKLEYLDLSRNHIKEIPEQFERMISLTHLDISSNKIGHLPHGIGNCSKLVYIDCSVNHISYLPETFSQLSMLEYFDAENNDIISSRDTWNTLSSLRKLNLRNNAYKAVYPDFGACINMSLLDLSLNKIETIPVEIGLLTSLQELRLHRNQLTTLPPELGSCRMLQRLEIPYNLIQGCLPETIGLVESIRFLDISFNKINGFPRSVIGLKNIVEINAEMCCISSLPDTFTYLDTLVTLNLSNNRFTRFPIEMSKMKSLKTLNMRNNSISLLQRNINVMTNVETLDLGRNQLRALPIEFYEIIESVPNLKMDENPWSDLPPRWGHIWPGKKNVDEPGGYTVVEALDFLYGMRSFYDTADAVWEEFGVFHYTNRLTFEDFIQEIRKRIPKTYHDGLIDHIKFIYFTARQSGVFPRWYYPEGDEEKEAAMKKENQLRRDFDKIRRDKNVEMARQQHEERKERVRKAYDVDLHHRTVRLAELSREHQVNDAYLDNAASIAFYHCIQDRQSKADAKQRHKNMATQKFYKDELKRLKDILEEDRIGREEEHKLQGKYGKREKAKAKENLTAKAKEAFNI